MADHQGGENAQGGTEGCPQQTLQARLLQTYFKENKEQTEDYSQRRRPGPRQPKRVKMYGGSRNDDNEYNAYRSHFPRHKAQPPPQQFQHDPTISQSTISA